MKEAETIQEPLIAGESLRLKANRYVPLSKDTTDLRISIITVTHNSAATLADTLESVKGQVYRNFEHIIVDGNSKDNTIDIVKSYPHVTKWISESDSCLYEAMNKGIRMATGDVIGILNSDDVYAHEQVLAKIAQCFAENGTDAVYSDLQYVKSGNMSRIVRNWKSGDFNRANFYYGWMPPHPTFFVKRTVLEKVGLYNLSFRNSGDYELMLRILFKHQFTASYLPEVLVKMRVGGISNRSFKNRVRANSEDRKAWKVNGLHPYFFTLFLKPLRKIFQFVVIRPFF